MNYDRHFQLKDRLLHLTIGVIVAAMVAAMFLLLWPVVHGVLRTLVQLVFAAAVLALVTGVVLCRSTVLELERMDREDRDAPDSARNDIGGRA